MAEENFRIHMPVSEYFEGQVARAWLLSASQNGAIPLEITSSVWLCEFRALENRLNRATDTPRPSDHPEAWQNAWQTLRLQELSGLAFEDVATALLRA